MLDNRFSDALETISLFLRMPIASNSSSTAARRHKETVSLQGLYTALSFALGTYSGVQQRMSREDHLHARRTSNAVSVAIASANGEWRSDQDAPGRGRLNDMYLHERPLTTPTAAALEFLVQCMEKLGMDGQAFVQGTFYLEVLRALVLENQPALVQRLLELRDAGKVRLKPIDASRAASIEDLARRALVASKGQTLGDAGWAAVQASKTNKPSNSKTVGGRGDISSKPNSIPKSSTSIA